MAFPLFHPEDPRPGPLFLSYDDFRAEFPAETDLIERKEGISPTALQDVVVAFSNSRGGVVLMGVADDGRVVGMPLSQRVAEKVHEAIGATRNPGRYSLRSVEVEGTEIAVLSIERRVEGFSQTSTGRVLVRVGPRNVALFDHDLARFIRDRSFHRFELTDSRVGVDEAATSLVESIAEAHGWHRRSEWEQRLTERGLLLPNRNLTVAGALFLTEDPQEFLGKAFIEILRFPDDDGVDYDRRITVQGPLDLQIEAAAGMLMEELGSELVVLGLERHELPRLPLVVVREALANAVAHRSYEASGTAVRVELRPTEVKVVSPGPLPAPVTVENIREAQAARNHAVIDVLRKLRLAEDAGRGVDVMQDSMRAEMLDSPTFSDTGHSVVVTLPVRGPVTARERAWVREVERRGEIEPQDRILLVHAARGETLTNSQARAIAGLDRLDATRALQRLRDAGLLVQQGARGGSSYVLHGSLNPPAGLRLTPEQLHGLVVEMATEGPISNADVRARTGLDRAAALRVLDELVAQGRLARTGQRRGTRYLLPALESSG